MNRQLKSNFVSITVVLILLPMVSLPSVWAGIYWESPANSSLRVGVRLVDGDDPGDTDPSFSETHKYYLEVQNRARRFAGVYIDRVYPSETVTGIDNGLNDRLINPAENVSSLDSIWTYFGQLLGDGTDHISKSRRYQLPIPDDLDPGEEVLYRLSIVGPAAYKRLPYPVTGSGAPPQANYLLGATAATAVNTLIGPLLRKFLGMRGEDDASLYEKMTDAVIRDVIAQIENSPDWMNKLVQGDYIGFAKDYMKHLLNNDSMVTELQSYANGKQSIEKAFYALGRVIDSWGTVGDLADTGFVLEHLIDSQWEEEYLIKVVAPQINAFVPNAGEPGDIIEIQGIGFAPFLPGQENYYGTNTAWFSNYTAEGDTIVLKGKAATTVLEAPYAATATSMFVVLPEDVAPGPVAVKVDPLTSNQLNFGTDSDTTLQITSPSQNAKLSATHYTVKATINNPPENWQDFAPTVWFYLDNQLDYKTSVTSETFEYNLDVGPLDLGEHKLLIELKLRDQTVSDTLTFNKVMDLSGFNLAHIRVRLPLTYAHTINGTRTNDWYITFGGSEPAHRGSFQGTRYTASWDEQIFNGHDKDFGSIGIVLNSDRDKINSFHFRWGFTAGTRTDTRYFQGENIPLTSSGANSLRFSVSGPDVCEKIVGDPLDSKVDTDPSAPYSETVSAWGSCTENSVIEINLFRDEN